MERIDGINAYNDYYKSAYSVLKLFIDKKIIANKDLYTVFSESNLTSQDYHVLKIMKKEGLINYDPIKDSFFILGNILNMTDVELNNLCFEIANKMLKEKETNQSSSKNKSSLNEANDAVAKTLVIGGIIVGSLLFVIGFFVFMFAPIINAVAAGIIMVVGAGLTGICLLVSSVLNGDYKVYIILFLLFVSQISVSATLLAILYM